MRGTRAALVGITMMKTTSDEHRNTWSRTDLLDCLEVEATVARSWTFFWPGRVVIEPLTDGVVWSPRGERLPLTMGTVLIAPPYAGHVRIEASAGASFRVLFEHPLGPEPTSLGRIFLPQIWAIPHGIGDVDALFEAAIEHLADAAPVSVRVSPFISRTQRSLAQTLTEDIDLEALSSIAGVDRCHLCRTFQKATGLPPYRFRVQLRIVRARMMLADGHECTEVAHAVGFCDQSHLTRSFKEVTGTTPSAYARTCARARQSRHELAA